MSYQIGGTLPVDASTYVTRPADEELYQSLKSGKFCYVLSSQQMGKSSLLVHAMQRLQAEGFACVGIDLYLLGVDASPEEWFAGVINRIVNALKLLDFDLTEWWEKYHLLSPVQRFEKFIAEILLPLPEKIILLFDEIDVIFNLSFREDFFVLIQACFNKRAENPAYNKINFVIFGIAIPSDLIGDKLITPFNITHGIELTGFEWQKNSPLAQPLTEFFSQEQADSLLKEIIGWTSGQPFLTQKVCHLVCEQAKRGFRPDLTALIQEYVIDNWEEQDIPQHFKTIRDWILGNTEQQSAALLWIYQKVLQQGKLEANNSSVQRALCLTGLVIKRGGVLQVGNRIYTAIFNHEWVRQELARLPNKINTISRNYLSPPIFPAAWACDFGEDRYGLWMAFSYQGVRTALRWIQPGTFMMGSPEDEEGRFDNEVLHQVTLTQGFWMGETTVTQALWQAVMGNNPSYFKGDNLPVEQVSWHDAQEFIQKLNQILQPHQPDCILRLPTKAEWEYACRAGTQTPFNFEGELTLEKVNYRGTWGDWENWGKGVLQKTAPVKSYPCNTWGLYEMHGNVWEWCQDNLSSEVATGLKKVFKRAVRGGSWSNAGREARSALCYPLDADYHVDDLSFRFVLGLQDK